MFEDSDRTEPVAPTATRSVEGALVAPEPAYDNGGPDFPTDEPTSAFVYAVGRIEPRFPSLGVEKEFAQATGRAETVGLTNRQALQEVLSERSNRYLLRQLCWVLTVEGLDTYVLVPHDPADLDLLVEALRPSPRLTDVDIVVGVRAGMTPPEACNGLIVPTVVFEQIYSFDVDSLLASIPRPEEEDEAGFLAVAEELLSTLLQMADNAGASDEHRALNYLAVRYPAIYAKAVTAYNGNAGLTRVEVRPSRLSGVRRIVDVIFTFTDRRTDVAEQCFVRVDVSEVFPFLITKLMPYYER